MSLEKIPFVLLASFAFKRCLTAPNPAPPDSEMITGKSVSSILNAGWYCQTFLRHAAVICGLMETALITAIHNPGSELSQFVLSTFLFDNGHATALRYSRVNVLGGVMLITGAWIRILTFAYLGKFFRFEASIQKDHELITSGPYAIVRHPSYTGLVISHCGWFLWNLGAGSWVRASGMLNTLFGKIFFLLYALTVILGSLYLTLTRMSTEDEALRNIFKDKWVVWAKNVKYMIIPGVY